jgi:hypothetical protein
VSGAVNALIGFGSENATPVSVYLVTDHLLTGAGVPAMTCGMQNSSVKIAIEEPTGTKVFYVQSWKLFPANLFTHSVLNAVYETYVKIEHDHGSILNLEPDCIVQKLTEYSLAADTAMR